MMLHAPLSPLIFAAPSKLPPGTVCTFRPLSLRHCTDQNTESMFITNILLKCYYYVSNRHTFYSITHQ